MINTQRTPFLSSARLDFYAPTLEDAPLFSDMQGDPNVMQFIGRGVRDRKQSQSLLPACVYHQAQFGFSLGPIYLKGTTTAVGKAGIYHFNLIASDPRIEIAFAFFKPHWGKGFATETVRALLQWAKDYHGIREIVAVVAPGNTASQHVLKKCGFEHTRDSEREGHPAHYFEYQEPKFF